MSFFRRRPQPVPAPQEDSTRSLRDLVEKLQAELSAARQAPAYREHLEVLELRAEFSRARNELAAAHRLIERLESELYVALNGPAPEPSGPVHSVREMRDRCIAAIRAAMPDEFESDAGYSRHALFDVLDEVAGEVARIPVSQ